MLKLHARINSSPQNLKICVWRDRQTSQRKMNGNFGERDIISDYEFLILIMDAFTVDTTEYKVFRCKWCKSRSDPLYDSVSFPG